MANDEEEPPLAIQIDQAVQEPSQSNPEQPQDDNVSVGVTVITGYLGAGKSTVIKPKPSKDFLLFFFLADHIL